MDISVNFFQNIPIKLNLSYYIIDIYNLNIFHSWISEFIFDTDFFINFIEMIIIIILKIKWGNKFLSTIIYIWIISEFYYKWSSKWKK